jgi:hypothetical protein
MLSSNPFFFRQLKKHRFSLSLSLPADDDAQYKLFPKRGWNIYAASERERQLGFGRSMWIAIFLRFPSEQVERRIAWAVRESG